MDWKAILALAVLVAPVAHCAADETQQRLLQEARIAEACLASGHMWRDSWGGGYCEELDAP